MKGLPGRKTKAHALRARAFIAVALFGALSGCGSNYDATTTVGKRAILDAANLALSLGDCDNAINSVLALYNSAQTDNEVRMTMASAYGCKARVNLFTLVGDLAAPAIIAPETNASSMVGLGIWSFFARTFVSQTGQDYILESASLGVDALLSVINSSAVVLPSGQINAGTRNPGSIYKHDRSSDANALLFFMSMAAMGSVQSRYGTPYTNGRKGVNLPWKTAATMDATGCGFASAFVNFVDSLSGLAENTTGTMAKTFTSLQTQFATSLSLACDAGCKGTAVGTTAPLAQAGHGWTATGCAIAAGCQGCPDTLRNRSSCTNVATDVNTCAAAGVVNFINNSAVGWVDGP